LANLRKILFNLKNLIKNKKNQLRILGKREVSIRAEHESDITNFNLRTKEHNQVLEALEIIIPKLKAIPNTKQKKHAIFAELAKIGTENPIAALVTLATSLNHNALNTIIEKLSEIRDSVRNSLKDDQSN
jgi:hypothetical protein